MKGLLKRVLRWDARSDAEKSLALFRVRAAVARAASPFGLRLDWLMRAAGTDKHEVGGHQYGPAYAAALRRFRWRRVRVLEIGIGGAAPDVGGRSLLAWLAYFPRATIVAADVRDGSALAGGRLQVRHVDQGDAASLRLLAAAGPFDVIIDDGSHLPAHQLLSFGVLFEALREGGLYVIEDVQTSYWHRAVGGVRWDGARPGDAAFAGTCVGWFLALAAHLNHAELLDPGDGDPAMTALARRVRSVAFEHNLILVTKGRNEAPSNTIGATQPGPRPGR